MKIIIGLLLSFLFFLPDLSFSEPPEHVKKRKAEAKETEPAEKEETRAPLSEKEIAERFELELGVPQDVFSKVFEMAGAFDALEQKKQPDSSSSPGTPISSTLKILVVSVGKANAQELKGEVKKEVRSQNLLNNASKVIESLKKDPEDGFGTVAREAGFSSAGEVQKVKHALQYGDPIPPELKKKLSI